MPHFEGVGGNPTDLPRGCQKCSPDKELPFACYDGVFYEWDHKTGYFTDGRCNCECHNQ
jgi:hypothetical protein